MFSLCRYVFDCDQDWAIEWDADRAQWRPSLGTIDAERVGNVSRCRLYSQDAPRTFVR